MERSNETPDEARQNMKNKVARGVAKVAGALEGFAEEAKKDELPAKAKEAIKKTGETTRNIAESTKEQGRKMRESVRGGRSSRHERAQAQQEQEPEPPARDPLSYQSR